MFVRRSDVSLRDSIHLESCVTGANAMSSSEDGSAAPSSFERTKRSIEGSAVTRPGITGFQSVAGVSVASIATLRGPVRRSRYGAIDSRHERSEEHTFEFQVTFLYLVSRLLLEKQT